MMSGYAQKQLARQVDQDTQLQFIASSNFDRAFARISNERILHPTEPIPHDALLAMVAEACDPASEVVSTCLENTGFVWYPSYVKALRCLVLQFILLSSQAPRVATALGRLREARICTALTA